MGKVMSGIPKPSHHIDFRMRNHSTGTCIHFLLSFRLGVLSLLAEEFKPSLVYVGTDEDAHGVKEKREKVSPEDFFVTMGYAMGLD
jgi:hypothetical protein